MKFSIITSPILILLATLSNSGVSAAPTNKQLVARDVYAPPITSLRDGDVWLIGSTQTVEWDISSPPKQITNPRGRLILAKGGYLDFEHPLVDDFDMLAGKQEVTVPSVPVGEDYAIVLFGDSGNFSPTFSIASPLVDSNAL